MNYHDAMIFLALSLFFMMLMILQYTKPGPQRRNNMMFLILIVFMNAMMWELYNQQQLSHKKKNVEVDNDMIPWPYWILFSTMLAYYIRFAILSSSS